MQTLIFVSSVVVNTVLVSFTVRRLMGVPVGWPRVFLFSFIASLIANPLLIATLEHVGVTDPSARESAGVTAAVSVMFVAWVIAVEISILVVVEILVPTGSIPGPVEFVRGLPAWFRRTHRFAEIFRIATRQGLVGSFSRSRTSPDRLGRPETAIALRKALTQGG